MAETPAPTLPCKQCGYVNEPERVYCHNCGTKLDRSVLPKEEEMRRESPEKARRRIQKMTNPSKGSVKREILTFIQTILWSAAVALLILIFRTPDNIPPVQKDVLARMIGSDFTDAVASPTPVRLTLTQDEINAFLKSTIKETKDTSFLASIIEFRRAYVILNPGICRIGMEKSLWGLPLYFGTDYKLEVIDGNFVPTNIGGSLGRVAIHPLIMQSCGYLFDGLWKALHREEQNMHQLQMIVIEKGKISLITKGAAKH